MTIKVETPNIGTNPPSGEVWGKSASELVAFYGASPVSQRSSSFQAASVVSVSSNITIAASLTAWILEVTNTLVGLGIWKGS